MTTPKPRDGRIRAYLHFIFAVCYFFIARSLAGHSAAGLASDEWEPIVEKAILAFLLLLGYAVMGFWLNRQEHPISEQGLPRREGWRNEIALGLATGWGLAVACILPTALIGGIAISVSSTASAWKWLVADAVFFAFATLVEEIAFRGYAFQRFVRAVGPIGASLGFAAYYAIVQSLVPGSSRTTFCVSLAVALLLSAAYLRTKALWISWGLNFAWKASRALLFGLAVAGVNSNSPVIQGDPMGPFWVTGGGYGLEASWITFILVLLALPILFRVTKDLDYRYNAPALIPGGIPVDLSAAAQAQHQTAGQHSAATGSEAPAPPALVQIGPAPVVNNDPPQNIERRTSDDSY
jgi:membrane protease YdiL (CAAX protease family)